MERSPVVSSNVLSVGYDPSTETLEVEYIEHRVYQYENVPLTVYNQLITAPSIGRYLNLYIKGKYQFREFP